MKFKLGKLTIRFIAIFAIIFIVIFFSISPIAKYMIEKNSEEWTGRKITMGNLSLNPLSGRITIKNIQVYEFKRKEIFFNAAKLHTNLSLFRLLNGQYMLETIQLISPSIVIEQNGNRFNYDDLLKRFISEDTLKKAPEPIKYRMEDIVVNGGSITYSNKLLNHEIIVQNFNLSCPLLAWNKKNISSSFGFTFQSGGKVNSSLALNIESLSYTLDAHVDKLDLQLVYPYMRDYMKTSYAGGLLSGNLNIKGDIDTPQAVAIKGDIGLTDFRIDDAQKQTVASWKNFKIRIDSLDVAANIYNFGKIGIEDPYMLVEMYATDNNFTRMMMPTAGKKTDVDSPDAIDYSNPFTIMAGYIKEISKNYIISNYTAENAEIRNGHIVYNDYTLEDKFTYNLEELNLKSGRINSRGDSITFTLSCLTNRLGRLNAYLAFDPKDYKNMRINYTIDKMRISDFNPYSKFYVAHAFVEGILHYTSTNTIHNGLLVSTNKIHINKIEVSSQLSRKGLYNLPLRLAIVLIRDKNGNIDFDIPVEGNLNDPKYKLGKAIWKILGNIVIKAATSPLSLLKGNANDAGQEELKFIRFNYLQKSLDKQQLKNLDLISQLLTSKTGLKVAIVQVASRENEKEALALFETKKDFYLDNVLNTQKEILSADDLKLISSISNNDSLYNAWLNAKLLPQNVSALPAQLKSQRLKGEEWLNQQVNILFETRNRFIMDYLVNQNKTNSQSIIITNTKDEKVIQFESTPRYTFDFMAK